MNVRWDGIVHDAIGFGSGPAQKSTEALATKPPNQEIEESCYASDILGSDIEMTPYQKVSCVMTHHKLPIFKAELSTRALSLCL